MRLSIAFCLIALVTSSSSGQTPEQLKGTIKYIQSLQQPDGSFVSAKADAKGKPTSSLRATSAAIRALKYFGGDLPNKDKVSKFVISCFDEKTGGYVDAPGGKPDFFISAVGIMAAVELGLPDSDKYITRAITFLGDATELEDVRIAAAGLESSGRALDEAAVRWVAQIEKSRNADGSYGAPMGDSRMTGSVLVLLLRLDAKIDDKQKKESLAVLLAGQLPDGGYRKAEAKGSDLETTYRVMRGFHMLKEKPKDVAKLKEFVAKCRNADGGYGVAPGQPSGIGPTYYASIVLKWLN